jgi:hypothetical protein
MLLRELRTAQQSVTNAALFILVYRRSDSTVAAIVAATVAAMQVAHDMMQQHHARCYVA